MRFNLIFTSSVLCLGLSLVKAQDSKMMSEMKAWGATTVYYSVGQVVYISDPIVEVDKMPSKELKQPYDIAVENGIEKSDIHLSLFTYPNPSSDYVTLKIENYVGEQLTYQLLDMKSDVLESKTISGKETQISIGGLRSEVYILNVLSGDKVLKTFHVLKN